MIDGHVKSSGQFDDTAPPVAAYLTNDLPAILEALAGTDVAELVLWEGGLQLRLHRAVTGGGPSTAEKVGLVEATVPAEPELSQIVSPLVGTFYRASKPGMPPLVAEGARVAEDTVVGIIEALHVLTEVASGCLGIVRTVHATDGMPVEYGQLLFEVAPLA
jgi:biotin carboxyl carrier protein